MRDNDEHLPAKAIRWMNRDLAESGLRVCTCCQGHPLPLTTEYFYRNNGRFRHTCKRCHSARETERAKMRYQTNEEARRRKRETCRAWQQAHLERHRASCRASAARAHQRRKAERLSRVLLQRATPDAYAAQGRTTGRGKGAS